MSTDEPDFTRAEASALLDFRQAVWLVLAVHHGGPGYHEAAADALALLDTPAVYERPDQITDATRQAVSIATHGPSLRPAANLLAEMAPASVLSALVRLGVAPDGLVGHPRIRTETGLHPNGTGE